jgi:arylsulfatase A-like enzyme
MRYLSICSFFFVVLSFSCKQKEQLPNILLIVVDDLGIVDLGCYGQQYIQTPHIDQLSAEGMRWSNAYSACPVCSPTRASILTGKNPARIHFTGHITAIERHRHPDSSAIIPPVDLMYIPYSEHTLAEVLKKAGYTTAHIGKWHVGGPGYWPTDQGFDQNIGGWTHGSPPAYFFPYKRPESSWNSSIPTLSGGEEGEYLPDRLTDEALRFIQEFREAPFFLNLSYYAVHTPLQAPDEIVEKYEEIVPGTGIDPVYAAMVEKVDENIGRILDRLDELGLSNNTVVVVTSDNGGLETVTDNGPYRRGKGHLYEGGIRIPLMIRWPGITKPGTVSQNRTISMDLYTTFLDMAGVDYDTIEGLDGRSLLKDFSGATASKQEDLFWYYPHYGIGQDPGAIIISGNYKLIDHYDPAQTELFDISADIGETRDMSGDLPGIADSLKTKLYQWLKSVDPIMHTRNPEHSKKQSIKYNR